MVEPSRDLQDQGASLLPKARVRFDLTFSGECEDLLVSAGWRMASPSIPSWNQILSLLTQMAQLREIAGSAA